MLQNTPFCVNSSISSVKKHPWLISSVNTKTRVKCVVEVCITLHSPTPSKKKMEIQFISTSHTTQHSMLQNTPTPPTSWVYIIHLLTSFTFSQQLQFGEGGVFWCTEKVRRSPPKKKIQKKTILLLTQHFSTPS